MSNQISFFYIIIIESSFIFFSSGLNHTNHNMSTDILTQNSEKPKYSKFIVTINRILSDTNMKNIETRKKKSHNKTERELDKYHISQDLILEFGDIRFSDINLEKLLKQAILLYSKSNINDLESKRLGEIKILEELLNEIETNKTDETDSKTEEKINDIKSKIEKLQESDEKVKSDCSKNAMKMLRILNKYDDESYELYGLIKTEFDPEFEVRRDYKLYSEIIEKNVIKIDELNGVSNGLTEKNESVKTTISTFSMKSVIVKSNVKEETPKKKGYIPKCKRDKQQESKSCYDDLKLFDMAPYESSNGKLYSSSGVVYVKKSIDIIKVNRLKEKKKYISPHLKGEKQDKTECVDDASKIGNFKPDGISGDVEDFPEPVSTSSARFEKQVEYGCSPSRKDIERSSQPCSLSNSDSLRVLSEPLPKTPEQEQQRKSAWSNTSSKILEVSEGNKIFRICDTSPNTPKSDGVWYNSRGETLQQTNIYHDDEDEDDENHGETNWELDGDDFEYDWD